MVSVRQLFLDHLGGDRGRHLAAGQAGCCVGGCVEIGTLVKEEHLPEAALLHGCLEDRQRRKLLLLLFFQGLNGHRVAMGGMAGVGAGRADGGRRFLSILLAKRKWHVAVIIPLAGKVAPDARSGLAAGAAGVGDPDVLVIIE